MFSMYRSADGIWRATSNKLPLWITASESLIGEHIEESEAALVMQKKGVA
jgi:hypothetical protein